MKQLIKDQCERNREKFGVITDSNFPNNEDLDQITQQTAEAVLSAVREVVMEARYEVDVDKVPTIQEEAWGNQYESKCEAFWQGENQGLKALDDLLTQLTNKDV